MKDFLLRKRGKQFAYTYGVSTFHGMWLPFEGDGNPLIVVKSKYSSHSEWCLRSISGCILSGRGTLSELLQAGRQPELNASLKKWSTSLDADDVLQWSWAYVRHCMSIKHQELVEAHIALNNL